MYTETLDRHNQCGYRLIDKLGLVEGKDGAWRLSNTYLEIWLTSDIRDKSYQTDHRNVHGVFQSQGYYIFQERDESMYPIWNSLTSSDGGPETHNLGVWGLNEPLYLDDS